MIGRPLRGRVVAPALAVVLAVVVVAGCTSSATSLRPRDAVTATAAQVVDASYTAALTGKRVSLMIPSGRVDLVLTAPHSTVPGRSVKGAVPLTAAAGNVLVGVSWVLQRAAFPDSPNRQLTEPSAIFGPLQPVHLWLVADGTRHVIPGVDDLSTPNGRPSTAVWLSLPAGATSWQFQLDYDGVTQTVDARSGKVDPGRAAPLYQPLPLPGRGTCEFADRDVVTSCLTTYAAGYPYVTGVGWAPAGKTWLLLQVDVESDTHSAPGATVDGVKPRHEIGDDVEPFSPFLVDAAAASLTVRGSASVDDLNHAAKVRSTFTGRLTGPGA